MSESKKQSFIALACVLSVNAFVGYQFLSTAKFDKLYTKEKVHDIRSPASQKIPGEYKEYDVLFPLEDYVLYDDFNGNLDYKMEVEFWSDKGAKYFTKNGKEAIEKGLTEGFKRLISKGKEDGVTLKSEVLPELTKEFLNTFVYSIKVVKLIDSNFEFDIKFRPHSKDTASYKDELASNQLINLDTTGTLYDAYKRHEKNFVNDILTVPRPVTNEHYQYLGGAITLAAELVDTNWKITQPIPNPKKNGVKGYLRLRKYYRANYPTDFKIDSFKSKNINITEQEFVAKNELPQVITVDTIYEYNLKNLLPKKTKSIIHFGTLVSLDKEPDNFIKKIFSILKKKNDIKTSEFKISGDYSHGPIKTNFTGKIKTLVYDYDTKSLSTKSRIITNPRDYDMRRNLKIAINKTLIKENSDFLIKNLKLEELIK